MARSACGRSAGRGRTLGSGSRSPRRRGFGRPGPSGRRIGVGEEGQELAQAMERGPPLGDPRGRPGQQHALALDGGTSGERGRPAAEGEVGGRDSKRPQDEPELAGPGRDRRPRSSASAARPCPARSASVRVDEGRRRWRRASRARRVVQDRRPRDLQRVRRVTRCGSGSASAGMRCARRPRRPLSGRRGAA